MDAASLALTAFNAIPSWAKTSVTFSRTVESSYDPVTGVTTASTTTATAPCVSQAARGTQSESFEESVAIREKYLVLTVPASPLGSFVPQADDQATINGETLQVTGCEIVFPGPSNALYRVTVSR